LIVDNTASDQDNDDMELIVDARCWCWLGVDCDAYPINVF
jgi:hypothetical protein